ncbi:lysozyme inhibitor LprI family protein [Marinobacter nauticus]|uniref:Lysozyme inhibitor LprI-like N-terminal domain-containing protein n=1 Tax=Marinobacter nauticus TaxID=2743 RepID=A0A1M2UX81_MARNT|nr:lysozyme inhibitor LprI family protein [Marinobacter nauticus]OJS99969.1 hypothetical protein BEE62_07600 [Marinobacter nauticus]
MKKLVFLFAVTISTTVLADDCDNPRDDFDGLYCLNKVYQEADRELNARYQELRGFLNSSEKSALKRTQLAWIDTRNSQCSFRRDGSFFVSLNCTTEMTVDRTNALEDRIRECRATGCQPSKL